eukprot:814196-Prorocentrum_minimum.AAC.2
MLTRVVRRYNVLERVLSSVTSGRCSPRAAVCDTLTCYTDRAKLSGGHFKLLSMPRRASSLPPAKEEPFDYIVVGGGTAGCVLASTLVQSANVSVLLLESGGDMPSTHKDVLNPSK